MIMKSALALFLLVLFAAGCATQPPSAVVDESMAKPAVAVPAPKPKGSAPVVPVKPTLWSFTSCLPAGIMADTVSSADMNGKKITVGELLASYGATCASGKLLDSGGREVRFYTLTGCWGNPPQDYQEILANQDREIKQLQATYRVITLTCNPGGVPIP